MELLVGDVKDKVTVLHPNPPILSLTPHQVALLVDDMIDSGTTLTLAARTLQEKGAKAVYALISHGNYSRLFASNRSLSQLFQVSFQRQT